MGFRSRPVENRVKNPAMPTLTVTDASLKQDVLESSLPVLLDFWAQWCAPCKQIAPHLEKLSEQYAGRLVVAKVDVDKNPRTAQAMGIRSIPTMVMFVDGRPVDAVQGALPPAQLAAFVEPYLAPPPAGGIAITVEALAQGLAARHPYTIVDIRAPVDFGRSHLRGAKNIEPADLPSQLPALVKRGPVVLVCRTGEQSKKIAEELEGSATPVLALEKGLLEWEGDGHPTYSNKEEAALGSAGA